MLMNHNVFTVEAHADVKGRITFVHAMRLVATFEQAEMIAASCPKFVRVKAGRHYGCCEHNAYAEMWVEFPHEVNDGKNAAGLKRLRAFLKITAWKYSTESSATRAQFDAFVGGV